MRDFRLFFRTKNKKHSGGLSPKKGQAGEAISVSMFSDFFSDYPDNFFCTNNMYSDFKESIITSIDIYNPKTNITLDIYESTESDESKREVATVGIRRYIQACYQILKAECIDQICSVSFFALLGIVIYCILYTFFSEITEWVFYCIETVASVLLWQFVGYWAFEFPPQYKELLRLKQIGNIEFKFHLWD